MSLKLISLTCCALLAIAASSLADGLDYHDQDLSKKDFTGQTLNGANFTDAVLKGATFTNASLKKANFKGADLTSAIFFGADLTGADLRETVGGLNGATGADISRANLEGLTFFVPFGAKFRGANLKNCKMTGGVNTCDFSGADLRGANLRGAQFGNGVGFGNNRWKGAIYDEETAWPEGFDPKTDGAILAKPDAPPTDKGTGAAK